MLLCWMTWRYLKANWTLVSLLVKKLFGLSDHRCQFLQAQLPPSVSHNCAFRKCGKSEGRSSGGSVLQSLRLAETVKLVASEVPHMRPVASRFLLVKSQMFSSPCLKLWKPHAQGTLPHSKCGWNWSMFKSVEIFGDSIPIYPYISQPIGKKVWGWGPSPPNIRDPLGFPCSIRCSSEGWLTWYRPQRWSNCGKTILCMTYPVIIHVIIYGHLLPISYP